MRIDLPNERTANLWLREDNEVVRLGVTRLGRRYIDGDPVAVYAWQVIDTSIPLVEGMDDLQASGLSDSPVAMLAALVSYLSACGESYAAWMRDPRSEPENLTLFPESMREWCYQISDELDMAAIELEEWRQS